MDALRFLDILGFSVGLIYLYLEYKASIWLWLASLIMPAIDMVLYFKAGLYADFGMAIYYCLIAIYGFAVWKFGKQARKKGEMPIRHFPPYYIFPAVATLGLVWYAIWWILSTQTNSTVPLTDAFTTALSVVAMWALARKYAEQWLLWLVVDAICSILYVYKGIPFKAAIYGLYTIVAVFGYRKWLSLMKTEQPIQTTA